MARASVELIVEAAKAVNPLRQVERQSKKVNQALTKSQRAARNVEAAFQRMGRNGIRNFRDLESGVARLGKRMSGLRANVAKLAIGFAAVKSAQAGIARAESVRRIQFLGQAYGESAQLQAAATAASEKFGLSQTEANKALANVFARLRPVGASLEDITSIYNGFNTVARISGASSVEASNAFTQLAQALGSGALRGDEFNSIAEQVPGILTAISQETGVAQGDLRKFAAEGKITSDVVLKALKRIEKEGAGQLEAALGGPAQAIKDFQNATEDVQIALTEATIPELARSFKILAQIITDLKPVIEAVGSFAAKVLGGISDTIQRIQDPSKAQKEMQDHLAEGRRKAAMRKPGVQNVPVNTEEQARFNAMFAAVIAPFASSQSVTQPPPANKIQPTNGALTNAEKISDAERLAELSRQEVQDLRDQASLASAVNEEEERRVQLNIDLRKIAENAQGFADADVEAQMNARIELEEKRDAAIAYNKELKKAAKIEEQARKDRQKAEEEARKARENDPLVRMQEELDRLVSKETQALAAATSIGNAFTDAFADVITGTKSVSEAGADMLKSIAADFLAMAKKIIAQQLIMILYQSILKALGGPSGNFEMNPLGGLSFSEAVPFADGGYVSSPTNALIGEGGEPEYVIPQSKMRESMSRYSRGARGSSVIPEVGGSGTSSGGGGLAVAAPIDVRYTVERINSVDYVTADQFQAGMQQAATQGAKQGEQQTLKRLQMSGSTRRRIGI